MTYSTYSQVIRDLNYRDEIERHVRNQDRMRYFDGVEPYIDDRYISKLKTIWFEHVKDKYEETIECKTRLGRFLSKYPLNFKEFIVLLQLVEGLKEKKEMTFTSMIVESEDFFKKHRVRYESSQLRRWKLVYRIINPLNPMGRVYEVSYKTQLALEGKKYTDAYQQLDLALEEESKRNSPDELESLYYIIEPKVDFSDLIAPKELTENLRSALSREKKKDQIFKSWGFGRVIEYGRGTTLNFRGPPGTGKTLAAHCLAKELNRKMLMVRYDQLQNAYIGVTEKHIQQVFKMAKVKDAVLFFDEADAIALSRESLNLSWEMSQVNTLLKELERFEGICIFATNFAEKYDEAFQRRLTMHVDFKLPDANARYLILDKVLPKRSREKKLKLKSIDLSALSGGDIKNVALNAAGIAARDEADKITAEHLREAVKLVKGGKNNEKKDTSYIS